MTRYFITGSSSGIGKEFLKLVKHATVYAPLRNELDLDDVSNVLNYEIPNVDIAIHFAGHDLGGGVRFLEHSNEDIVKVLNCNFVSTIMLSKLLYKKNPDCLQVFISSTNLDKFYPNNLVYNLGKNGVKTFIELLRLENPNLKIKEARVGLTKTAFNQNRHRNNHKPINDLYKNPHMTAIYVAKQILRFTTSDKDFLRINEQQI